MRIPKRYENSTFDNYIIENPGQDRASLNEIITDRHNNKKPTILISNKINEVLTERYINKLIEEGGKSIIFDWDDYRPKIKSTGIWD